MEDPRLQTVKYLQDKQVIQLFEYLTTKIMTNKPDNPEEFILSELRNIDERKKSKQPVNRNETCKINLTSLQIIAFSKSDLAIMFDAFDITNIGNVSQDQYLEGQ
jgi:hypothetical protein